MPGNSFCIKQELVVLEGNALSNAFVTVTNGIIQDVSTNKPGGKLLEYANSLLLPGFIDLHTHGRNGESANNITAELLKSYTASDTTELLQRCLTVLKIW